jgi:hypothetical protein
MVDFLTGSIPFFLQRLYVGSMYQFSGNGSETHNHNSFEEKFNQIFFKLKKMIADKV